MTFLEYAERQASLRPRAPLIIDKVAAPTKRARYTRPTPVSGGLVWGIRTRDMSPAQIVSGRLLSETPVGKATMSVSRASRIDGRDPTNDSKEYAAWKRAMGIK